MSRIGTLPPPGGTGPARIPVRGRRRLTTDSRVKPLLARLKRRHTLEGEVR